MCVALNSVMANEFFGILSELASQSAQKQPTSIFICCGALSHGQRSTEDLKSHSKKKRSLSWLKCILDLKGVSEWARVYKAIGLIHHNFLLIPELNVGCMDENYSRRLHFFLKGPQTSHLWQIEQPLLALEKLYCQYHADIEQTLRRLAACLLIEKEYHYLIHDNYRMLTFWMKIDGKWPSFTVNHRYSCWLWLRVLPGLLLVHLRRSGWLGYEFLMTDSEMGQKVRKAWISKVQGMGNGDLGESELRELFREEIAISQEYEPCLEGFGNQIMALLQINIGPSRKIFD